MTENPRGMRKSESHPAPGRAGHGSRSQPKRSIANAARRLTQSEAVLGSIQDGLLVLDKDWRCTYANEAAAAFLKSTPRELIGKVIWETLPHVRSAPFYEEFTRAAERKVFARFEEYYEPLGRWYECRCYPADEGLTVFLHDTTGHKQIEEALVESRQVLEMAIAGSNAGVWRIDLNPEKPGVMPDYAYISPQLKALIGFTDDEFPNSRSAWFSRIPPEDVARMEESVRAHAEGRTEYHQVDFRIRHKDGGIRWLSTRGRLYRDEFNRPIRWAGIDWDITDRKLSEEALHASEERARRLQQLTLELSQAEDRERRRLAEVLHDDLQQMLAAAKFHLGLLSREVKTDDTVQELAGQVKEMLQEAINKSRSLSHELSPPGLSHSDLYETFEWLAQQMQARHGLTVDLRACERIEIQSEPLKALLYKAAQEMLFNVIRHARVKEARLRLRRRRGRIYLSVSDRGRGFDPRQAGRTGGFGLLGIHERVELLGGRMKVRSIPGRGSAFLIGVPASEPRQVKDLAAGEVAPEPAAWKKRVKSPGDRTLRVLLVDDHNIVREGLESMLVEERDIEIVGQAGNGREAVDLAHQLQPDVVVMDVAMPVMGGDEATRQIKRHLPDTRVVALSMFDDARVAEKMRKAGAAAYLLKTAPSEELLAAIRGA